MMGCGTSSPSSATPNGHQHNGSSPLNDPHAFDPNATPTIGNFLTAGQSADAPFASTKPAETLYEAYQRHDENICRLEQMCPGPRLATIDAWIEHLQLLRRPAQSFVLAADFDEDGDEAAAIGGSAMADDVLLETTGSRIGGRGRLVATDADGDSMGDRAAIARLAVQLQVAFDADRARTNETHLAEVSAGRMERIAGQLHADILDYARQRGAQLTELYGRLKWLYDEQDVILGIASSGKYTSAAEESLDQRLDEVRQIRDKIGAVAEQWRIAGNLLRTGAKEAIRAQELWTLVGHSKIASERVQLALDAQSAGQAALVAVEYAQKALPHVEFPHITRRRSVATRHACEYALTDVADAQRFAHTLAVLEAYRSGAEQTHRWLHDTFRRTLRVNLLDAEASVVQAAKLLRIERARQMRSSGAAQRLYVVRSKAPPGTD